MSLVVSSLEQGYRKKSVIRDISFEVEKKKIVTLLGPNGSGKSTLMKTICGVIKPKSGCIYADGEDITGMDLRTFARTIGYVPQKYNSLDYMKVFDAVLIGRAPHMNWSYSDTDFEKAHAAMEMIGIIDLADKNVNELSGGQMQKVAIARALAQEPKYLILDEPISALDMKNQLDVLKIVREITRHTDTGVLISMHHLGLSMQFSDYTVLLKGGTVYNRGLPDEVITEKSISDVFGVKSEILIGHEGKFIHVYDN